MTKPNYPSAGQGILAGMEAPDSLRHPMFTPPDPNVPMLATVRALRKQIARAMTPFDGREDMELILTFAEQVYSESEKTALCENVCWLVGKIHFERAKRVKRMRYAMENSQPANQGLWRRDIAVIERLADEFANAVLDEVVT